MSKFLSKPIVWIVVGIVSLIAAVVVWVFKRRK